MNISSEEIKYLEFIQSIITRMNSNSFSIKGWATTITSAIIGIFIASKNNEFILIGVLVCTIFWLLDAYYLHQEKKYRDLYERVRISPNISLFDLNASIYKKGFWQYFRVVFWSKTITPLYLFIIAFLLYVFNKIQL